MSFGRHRETTDGAIDQTQTLNYRTYPGDILVGTYLSYAGEEMVKKVDDSITPDLLALKKCGKFLPLNPFQVSTVRTRQPASRIDVHSTVASWRVEGSWAGNLGIPRRLYPDPPDPDVLDEVVLTASQRASSAQVDVLTEMFQLKDDFATLKGVAELFNARTYKMAIDAVRTARHPRISALRRFRDLWLEARYGVRPLVYLAQDVVRAVNHKRRQGLFNRGTAHQDFTIAKSDYVAGENYYCHYRTTESLTGTMKLRGTAYTNRTPMDTWGFDPVVTAWELTRYSFIVDWFINVGGYLATVRPRLTGTFAGVCDSVRVDATWVRDFQILSLKDSGIGEFHPVTITETTSSYVRLPTSVPLPHFSPSFSLAKFVDLVAIFVAGRQAVERVLRHGR